MKRIEMAHDYSEFLIRSKMNIRHIEKALLDGHLDMAKFMAHELKITAMLLRDAIEREELKQSKD